MYVTGPFLMTNLLYCNSEAVKFTTYICNDIHSKQMVETAYYTPGMQTFIYFITSIYKYACRKAYVYYFKNKNKSSRNIDATTLILTVSVFLLLLWWVF